MDKQLYAIDRIEDTIVLLENTTTKEKKEINKNLLPNNIKEGNIIEYINNTYKINIKEEKYKRQQILNKFKKLRKD